MAITKNIEIYKIDATQGWFVSVRTDTVLKEDGVEIGRSNHRHALVPFASNKDENDSWTHTPTDISGEDAQVKAVVEALWTDEVKDNYKTMVEKKRL
jgi:hypothetical protein